MTARSLIFGQKRERELSELAGRMLEVHSLSEARLEVLRLASCWLGTDSNFWVQEPRSLRLLTPEDEPLLATLQPIDMMKLGQSVAVQRQFNPFIKLAMKSKITSVFSPADVLSERLWHGNPFRSEVCVPLGAAELMAVEVDEKPEQTESLFVVVVGRHQRSFTELERYWFERLKWTVQPLVQHLRAKGFRDGVKELLEGTRLLVDPPFTPREREVFQWMLEGKRNKEIAIILECSPSTIKKHVASILCKTGAETRTGALRAWMGG
jgi:DNA-binding CsgD family transcriptional regulator